jgi:hypothetical protein
MNHDPLVHAVTAFRWLTAGTLLAQNVHVLIRPDNAFELGVTVIEIVATCIFLVPRTRLVGAGALLILIAGALAIHMAQGRSPIWLLYPAMLIILTTLVERRLQRV